MLRFTVPAGVVTAAATFASYLVARGAGGTTLAEARTAALLGVFGVALWVLVLVARPLNLFRVVLIAAMAGSFAGLFVLGLSRDVFSLAPPGSGVLLRVLGIVLVAIAVLTVWVGASGRRRRAPPGEPEVADLVSP